MTARKLAGLLGCCLAGALASSQPARAAIHCSWVTIGPVAFGTYEVFNPAPDDAVGSVTFNCKGVGSAPVIIDLSTGGSGTYAARRLTGPGVDTLTYNLFLNATRTQVWGNGTGGTAHYGATIPGNNVNILVNIYGRIPAGQDKAPGTYADTIVATINF